jgi:hypothetical protein
MIEEVGSLGVHLNLQYQFLPFPTALCRARSASPAWMLSCMDELAPF